MPPPPPLGIAPLCIVRKFVPSHPAILPKSRTHHNIHVHSMVFVNLFVTNARI